MGRVVALTDIVMLSSASRSIRLMVDLPAPEGDDSTIRRPRRRRVEVSMSALASGEPWPSSGGLMHCTKIPLKLCGAMHIVHCNITEGMISWQTKRRLKLRQLLRLRPRLLRLL